MHKKQLCVICVGSVKQEVERRIRATAAPFSVEDWIYTNLAEIKAIPMPRPATRNYAQGRFSDLITLLHHSVCLSEIKVDNEVECRFVGNTLLLTF